jgi:hypothetical protein
MKAQSEPKQKRDGFIARFFIRVISRGIEKGMCAHQNNLTRSQREFWKKHWENKKREEAKAAEENKQ